MNINELSIQIKEKRGARGIRAVAEEIGISSATLSRVERGKQPDLHNFAKICKWLNVDPNAVLGLQSAAANISYKTPDIAYVHFRAEREMTTETAQKLADLILSVQKAFISKD